MDHNGLYTDLDSFTSITNCGTTNNSYNDTCSTLPSLNNFKYHQTNLSSSIYQPVQTIHDQQQQQKNQQQQQQHHSAKSTSLPQTQININNCNNNIFFPHDDGIFDANASTTCPPSTNSNTSGQKNNFIGYMGKDLGSTRHGVGGLTVINNVNTNIVNNIQNPTNFVNGSDIFGSDQYHQINKPGETIINFTNNNLNGGSSMPTDTVTATSQNYYGYQSNAGQGQQSVYESTLQSQSSTFSDPSLSASKSGMGTTGTGLYHGHHHSSLNQTMTNGSYLSGNTNTIPSEHSASSVDLFSEYQEPLSTAKIINQFESKNPLKYSTNNRTNGSYYKNPSEYPPHQYAPPPGSHLPPHNYSSLYQTPPKISTHSYDPYSRISRNAVPHYPTQNYPAPQSVHSIEDQNRLNYNRPTNVQLHGHVPSYHHPHSMPHHPSGYPNYYPNGYGAIPYSAYPQMPGPPYDRSHGALMRNESCSKTPTNYKTSAVALSPVDHNSFSLPHATNYSVPKKDFYTENPYFSHSYYEDQMNSALNSCAKKSSRQKVSGEMYNPSGSMPNYTDHHSISHHPQNVNIMRNINVGYQPMSKLYAAGNSYPMPSSSCEIPINPYHNFNYHYKTGEHPKMTKVNPAMSSKQFKNYGHFEQFPHPHYSHPQYHTMQAKHPEKIKISIDLEEQINSSKIPKLRDSHHPSYGFDPHHPYYQYHHHHMPSRNVVNDNDPKNPIANINISLRDFLSTWNEIDDDDETSERRPPVNGVLDDLNEHMERTIMREYNPMFVQKATDSFISASDVPSNSAEKSQLTELESGIISEGTEKLYVLESIDVPLSELNKYKHLNVINKLPEHVVINDKEPYPDLDGSMKLIEETDLAREKLYKSEFELEFEACQEQKILKPIDEPIILNPEKPFDIPSAEKDEPPKENTVEAKISDTDEMCPLKKKKKTLKTKTPKLKGMETKHPKSKQCILKLKKEKILKAVSRKVRITKRAKKYSLNQQTSSVKTLSSICVDFLNTSAFRNHAREKISTINKNSKMRILQDIKKKFNFDAIKRRNPVVNQKLNHSVRINSLREICGKLLNSKSRLLELNDDETSNEMQFEATSDTGSVEHDCPTLKELCKTALTEMDINVMENDYLYSPLTLKELCEMFIYSHRQYFVIEEFSNIPKLQDLCKNILSETNIFINIDGEEASGIFELNDEPEVLQDQIEHVSEEPIYIVEENSSNVGELFESENLNSFEKSEILRKIQRVASFEDDEIIRAIGELHRDDDESIIINNNNSNVHNKNISCANGNFSETNEFPVSNEPMKFESEMSFISFMEDDLMHSVQHEEIISENDRGNKATKKIVEILRHKYLNRSDIRQATKTIKAILNKSFKYQRADRFHNANRRHDIEALKNQARAALLKLKEAENCDNSSDESRQDSDLGTTSSSSSLSEEVSAIKPRESKIESQIYAKDDTEAQLHQIFNHELEPISIDSPADNRRDNLNGHAERIFPKLPSVFPSINEYRIEIDRKSSSQCDVRDICNNKKRKLNFDESLLSIERNMYSRSMGEIGEENQNQNNERHRSSTLSVTQSKSTGLNDHHRRRHHSSHHESSHSKRSHDHISSRLIYRNDQMNHSEAKRLVIPSYKLYDKDLDVKLKIMPFVRIEREERVDDLVKQYD